MYERSHNLVSMKQLILINSVEQESASNHIKEHRSQTKDIALEVISKTS